MHLKNPTLPQGSFLEDWSDLLHNRSLLKVVLASNGNLAFLFREKLQVFSSKSVSSLL